MGTIPPAPDSTAAQWSLIVGFFLSPLISLLLQCHWPARVKALVAFTVYVLVGTGTVWSSGQLDTAHWATTLLAVVATAISGYVGHRALWQPTGVAGSIEAASTPGKPAV